jgi:hypothetical protein
LCKVSVNPETCILRSAESFYKRGKTTLVVAKFIPGVNTMGPPLAGSMKMRFSQRDFLKAIGQGFQVAGHAIEETLIAALVVYAIYRIWLMRRNRVDRTVPRVQVQELIDKLSSEEADRLLVVDVRSHGYYDPDAARIRGSIRIEPNNLEQELQKLPKDRDIYLYCT